MSRFTSLSSTSRILFMGQFRGGLKGKAGNVRYKRRGAMHVRLPPASHQWHADGEAASFSQFAFDEHLAAHQLAQLLAQRQAESRTAIFARAGVVRDSEFFKEIPGLIGSDADAGVDDIDDEIISGLTDHKLGRKLDLANLGELRRVVEQLSGHILELARVAESRSEVRGDRTLKVVRVVCSGRLGALADFFKQ